MMKDKTNDPIILLKKNGSIDLVSVDELDENTKKSSDTKFILIDVGLTTSEYLVIPRERFIRKFREASIEYNYHVEVYIEGFTNNSEARPGRIICKNVVEFYRAVHSLQKIFASNRILHDDFYYMAVEGKLTDVIILTNIKDKIREICIEASTTSDTKHDIVYVLETLNFMVFKDPSIPIIPDKLDNPGISINLSKRKWSSKLPMYNMISLYQGFFNCTSFIPKEDYTDLCNIGEYHITLTDFIYIKQNPLPAGEEINTSNINEYDGYNIEVLRENDISAYIYSTENLVEILVNAKYIYDSSILEADACYGYMDTRSLLAISYRFKTNENTPNYGSVIVFDYDINEESIERGTDFYEDFMKKMRKNYKKFMRGEAIENG